MAGQRRLRILSRLIGVEGPDLETKRLCEVCAEVTVMTGAGIMLMSGDMPRGSVCTTNAVSAVLEELQYAREACMDAPTGRTDARTRSGRSQEGPVAAFSGPAVQAGARAVSASRPSRRSQYRGRWIP